MVHVDRWDGLAVTAAVTVTVSAVTTVAVTGTAAVAV